MEKDWKRGWHGAGADLKFEPGDFEIVDLCLGQIPELRICASGLKRARAKGMQYPIVDHKPLIDLLDGNGKEFKGGGHHFGAKEVAQYMPTEYFPIHNEAEFVSRLYIALVRCKHEEATRARSSADVLLTQQTTTSGRVE